MFDAGTRLMMTVTRTRFAQMIFVMLYFPVSLAGCSREVKQQALQTGGKTIEDSDTIERFRRALDAEASRFLQACEEGALETWSSSLKDPWGNPLHIDSSTTELSGERFCTVELRSPGPNRKLELSSLANQGDDIALEKTNWKTPRIKDVEWDKRLNGLWQDFSTGHFIQFSDCTFTTFRDVKSIGLAVETNGATKFVHINDSLVIINEVSAYKGENLTTPIFQFTGNIAFRQSGLVVIMPIAYPIKPPGLGHYDLFQFTAYVLAKADPNSGVDDSLRSKAMEEMAKHSFVNDGQTQDEQSDAPTSPNDAF